MFEVTIRRNLQEDSPTSKIILEGSTFQEAVGLWNFNFPLVPLVFEKADSIYPDGSGGIFEAEEKFYIFTRLPQ